MGDTQYDILIINGTVFDGSGKAGTAADLAIRGDRIVAVAPGLKNRSAGMVIDASNRAVAPGFIDPHSHTDIELLVNPRAESKIHQGVTTEIGGNCGFTMFPLDGDVFENKKRYLQTKYNLELTWTGLEGFLKRLEENGTAVNYATFLGHGSLREAVLGPINREATLQELSRMKDIVRQYMESGVFGLSTGLIYAPGCFAKTKEIIELSKIVSEYGGIYATHMRDEGDFLLEAVEEAIRVGTESNVSLQISHLKMTYPRNWAKIHEVLSKISQVKAEGLEILADRYPYMATSTFLSMFFPNWIKDGSFADYLNRLQDRRHEPELRRHIKKQEERIGSWDNIAICSVLTEKNRPLTGKSISAASAQTGKDPFEFIRDLVIEEQDQVSMINFSLNEDNFKRIMLHPLVVIGSDGWALAPYGKLAQDKPHPRSYGTFPRMLGRYVREEKIMSLGLAIEKMTSITARKFGLFGRGELKEGYFADVVIFDPEVVSDIATWEEPHQYPRGIEHVIVNGKFVIERGNHTGRLPGKVFRKSELNPHWRWPTPPSA